MTYARARVNRVTCEKTALDTCATGSFITPEAIRRIERITGRSMERAPNECSAKGVGGQQLAIKEWVRLDEIELGGRSLKERWFYLAEQLVDGVEILIGTPELDKFGSKIDIPMRTVR